MASLKQKWQTAEAPEKLMIVGGAMMVVLILVAFINFMIPKKPVVQQYVQQEENPMPAVYAKLEEIEANIQSLNQKIEQAVAYMNNRQDKSDASYKDAFGTLAAEVENHRVVLESIGRLQAVPKSIRVIHENKGESRGRGEVTE